MTCLRINVKELFYEDKKKKNEFVKDIYTILKDKMHSSENINVDQNNNQQHIDNNNNNNNLFSKEEQSNFLYRERASSFCWRNVSTALQPTFGNPNHAGQTWPAATDAV
ncbi:hypothetical protein PFDG_05114 [Plasmodium falciparum Dd2]|uniref:Uncharacterized protein n=1 Tax=Plasmodium falciparum (isolate Dd2) TaxID=57267 RepID=A0A0L7MAD7_PLAF4|nr:hypothetical protein PFDG_05114 [Plasmodium falciparum Dd2]